MQNSQLADRLGQHAAANGAPAADSARPVLPDFGGACISNIVPTLLGASDAASSLFPYDLPECRSVILFALDGLGWLQLQENAEFAPTMMSMRHNFATTVAPSTTSTALTSLVTGTPPGQHGLIGHRILVGGEVLNTLRWKIKKNDARKKIVPEDFKSEASFLGQRPVVIQNAEFAESGFSKAHLGDARLRGWNAMSAIVVEIGQAVAKGEPFIYAYYDGIDKTAHMKGFGDFFTAELTACDKMIAELLSALPKECVVVITSDHGIVECSDEEIPISKEVQRYTARMSGEARFRWLHAHRGRQRELLAAAKEAHSHQAWVLSCEEMIEGQWFGPYVTPIARKRLGDVAVVAKEKWHFGDPNHKTKVPLVGRHGSATDQEMLIPVLSVLT